MIGAEPRETLRGKSERLRLRVRGAVQGVGFRPFAHRIATRYGLSGFVYNDADGVLIEIQGARCGAFLSALRDEPPPLAVIETIDVEPLKTRDDAESFTVIESASGRTRTRIVADVATCPACLDELFDASSRFHLYPFVTCTDCGPRFTIAASLPYDRARTSMAAFPPCLSCAADYSDPGSRRFHAETIACAQCGPRLDHEIPIIISALRRGAIVALKGIGGYQLMCDARNEEAVASLRKRKQRDAKPFAVMAANIASVALFAEPSPTESDLLVHPAAPIVLIDSRGALAPSVAPGLRRVGVMLPCAPLHHLLFHAAAGAPSSPDWRRTAQEFVLVATSANPGGEPLVTDDEEATRRLSDVADLIVGHDRAILRRADDSVMSVIDGAPAFLRRARGFVANPIDIGTDGPCIAGLGGHLKSTITITRGREAFVSQHIGDLDNAWSARFFEETLRDLLSMLNVVPEFLACDLHPDFFSTRVAEEMGFPLLRVQHHAAHVAAIGVEHGVGTPILGVALDGYGMGDDGGAWGGELMLIEGARWTRLGHLAPLPLPGGDRAAREPWRMGVAALAAIGQLARANNIFPEEPRAGQLAERLRRNATPTTTSMGRLFDAAAALSGVCSVQSYEGQAAMALEALARAPRMGEGGFRLEKGILDFSPVLSVLARGGMEPRECSEYFHGAVIEGCATWIEAHAKAHGLAQVALGGGCLMNVILAEGLSDALRARSLSPIFARKLPCNDSGLSLGQAAMARAFYNERQKVSSTCV